MANIIIFHSVCVLRTVPLYSDPISAFAGRVFFFSTRQHNCNVRDGVHKSSFGRAGGGDPIQVLKVGGSNLE